MQSSVFELTDEVPHPLSIKTIYCHTQKRARRLGQALLGNILSGCNI